MPIKSYLMIKPKVWIKGDWLNFIRFLCNDILDLLSGSFITALQNVKLVIVKGKESLSYP